MRKLYRITSIILLTCFSFNTAISESLPINNEFTARPYNFNLATGSMFSKLRGIEHKDVGRIKIALETRLIEKLSSLDRDELENLNLPTLKDWLRIIPMMQEETIFSPVDMQLFFNEMSDLPGNNYVIKCRVTDKKAREKRTYYAVFSPIKDPKGGFAIEVYREDEFDFDNMHAAIELTKKIPRRKGGDAKAIDRYIQHEKNIDRWIRERMQNPDNYLEIDSLNMDRFLEVAFSAMGPMKNLDRFFYGRLKDLLRSRRIVLVKVRKGESRPVVYEEGKEIEAGSHSSQNAIYIFMEEDNAMPPYLPDTFDNFKRYIEQNMMIGQGGFRFENQYAPFAFLEALNIAAWEINPKLVHELGVICGLDYEITDNGEIINGMDRLYVKAFHKEYDDIVKMPLASKLDKKLSLVNLNHIRGEPNKPYERDYAYIQTGPPGERRYPSWEAGKSGGYERNGFWDTLRGHDRLRSLGFTLKSKLPKLTLSPVQIIESILTSKLPKLELSPVQTITKIWEANYEKIIDEPFSLEAQEVFVEILQLFKEMKDVISREVAFRIQYALLFSRGDFKGVLGFYELYKKEIIENRDAREYILSRKELLMPQATLYFTAKMMDPESVKRFVREAKSDEGFFEFYAKELFGEDINLYHVLGEDRIERTVFKERIIKHIGSFAKRYVIERQDTKALQLLENLRICMAMEAERIRDFEPIGIANILITIQRLRNELKNIPKLPTVVVGASLLRDLKGREHKDIARITIGLQNLLDKKAGRKDQIGERTLSKLGKQKAEKDSKYNLPVHFRFDLYHRQFPNDIRVVMCSVYDKEAGSIVRSYYAAFSTKKNDNNKFPVIGVYTQDEYERITMRSSKLAEKNEFPERKEGDRQAIERYIKHESYDQNVISWVHKNNGKKDIHAFRDERLLGFGYGKLVEQIITETTLAISARDKLSLTNRNCYIIPITDEVRERLKENTVTIPSQGGLPTKEVIAYYHTSNNAMHIFLEAEKIDILRSRSAGDAEKKGKIIEEIKLGLAHEVGVMLGKQPAPREILGQKYSNEIDLRYSLAQGTRLPPMKYSVVDLDENLLSRDYALMQSKPDESGPTLTEKLEHEIDTIWKDVGDDSSQYFNPEAQEAFTRIIQLVRLAIKTDVYFSLLGKDTHRRIIIANLYGNNNYKETINYFDWIKSLPAEQKALRKSTLHDKNFIKLYFMANSMSTEDVMRFVAQKEGYFEYFAIKLFGDIVPFHNIFSSLQEEERFKLSAIESISQFIRFNLSKGNVAMVLSILQNAIIISEKELELESNPMAKKNIEQAVTYFKALKEQVERGMAGNMDSEPPVAGMRDPYLKLKHLAPHPLVNALIGMMLENHESNTDFVEQEKNIYWFGNKDSNNESFLDIFYRLAETNAPTEGMGTPGLQDRLRLARELVRRAGLERDIKVNEEFLDIIETSLSLQFEHFSVEKGTIYAMSNYKLLKNQILKHVALEREFHLDAIFRTFRNDHSTYLLWRSGKTSAIDIMVEVCKMGVDARINAYMTYNEFAESAHMYAQSRFPLGKNRIPRQISRKLAKTSYPEYLDVATAGVSDNRNEDARRRQKLSGVVRTSLRERALELIKENFNISELKWLILLMEEYTTLSSSRKWENARSEERSDGRLTRLSAILDKLGTHRERPNFDVRLPTRDKICGLHMLQNAFWLKTITDMRKQANDTGLVIPYEINKRYTLLVDQSLYKDTKTEIENDMEGYTLSDGRHMGARDRFNIEAVDSSNVNNILKHVKNPERTIVQISNSLNKDQVDLLLAKAPKLRIINIDTTNFKYDKELNNMMRRDCRFNLYAMMLAARKITTEDITAENSTYRTLTFFLNTHYKDGTERIAPLYIDALINNKADFIIHHALSYRPTERWRLPDYKLIAVALISA